MKWRGEGRAEKNEGNGEEETEPKKMEEGNGLTKAQARVMIWRKTHQDYGRENETARGIGRLLDRTRRSAVGKRNSS